MRSVVMRELYLDWLPNITDEGLERLIELLSTQSPQLLHGSFIDDDDGGCLAEHAGRHHDLCGDRKFPGLAFAMLVTEARASAVITEWDKGDPRFAEELLRAFQNELVLRQRPSDVHRLRPSCHPAARPDLRDGACSLGLGDGRHVSAYEPESKSAETSH